MRMMVYDDRVTMTTTPTSDQCESHDHWRRTQVELKARPSLHLRIILRAEKRIQSDRSAIARAHTLRMRPYGASLRTIYVTRQVRQSSLFPPQGWVSMSSARGSQVNFIIARTAVLPRALSLPNPCLLSRRARAPDKHGFCHRCQRS